MHASFVFFTWKIYTSLYGQFSLVNVVVRCYGGWIICCDILQAIHVSFMLSAISIPDRNATNIPI